MVKRLSWTILILLLTLVLLPAAVVADASKPLVNDLADVFTPEQESALEQQAAELGNRYNLDLVLVTTADAQGKSSRDYADDFFDENGYGLGPERDGILFLIDYDNREAYISTSGSGIRYLTDARIEDILDRVVDGGLSSGDNMAATKAFLTTTSGFLAAGIPADQYTETETQRRLSLIDMILGGIAALGSGLGLNLVTTRNYQGHPKPYVFGYQSNSIVSMGIALDNLVDTKVTSRLIPRVNTASGTSSGRSTIHRSGGGGFHGGGGRKF